MNVFDIIFIAGDTMFLFIAMVYFIKFIENKDKLFKKNRVLNKKLPRISVVIPAWNEEENIANTIKSIKNQNYPKEKMEIIVVNDGSTDKTGEIAKSFSGITVIDRVKNPEFNELKAGALNAGIKKAKNEILVLIDADSILKRDAIRNAVWEIVKNPELGAVSGSVLVEKPKTWIQYVQYIDYLNMDFYRKTQNFLNGVFCIPGPLGVFKKSVLKKIGMFPPGHITEDLAITYGLHRHGYKIKTANNAISYSVAPKTLMSFIKQRIRWYKGSLLLILNNRDMLLNKKFGDYGMFILPTNYLVLFIVILFNIFIFKRYYIDLLGQKLGLTFAHLSTNTAFSVGFNTALLKVSFMDLKLVFALAMLTIFFTVLYIIIKINKQKISLPKILALVPFVWVYGFILSFVWVRVAWDVFVKREKAQAKWSR